MQTGSSRRRAQLGLPLGRTASAVKQPRTAAHLSLLPSKRHRAETPLRKSSGHAQGLHVRLPRDVTDSLAKNREAPRPSQVSSVIDSDGTAAVAFAESIYVVAAAHQQNSRLLYHEKFADVFDKHRTAPFLALHTESTARTKHTHVLACAHFGKLVWLICNDTESSRSVEGSIPLMEEETITSVAVSGVAGLVGSNFGNMFLVRYTSAASLTVQQLEKPTSLAGQLLGYTQTMTKAMWNLLGSAAASRAPSAGSSVIRVISAHSRDTPLPYGMLVLTERSLMMWTLSAGEHELLWEDNMRSRLERHVDESEQNIASTVHLLDAQLVGPTAERYSFVVAVMSGFESQHGMAELRLHTVKCTLGGNQPPEALRLFRLPADGLPLAVFRNQECYFRTEFASLNEPAAQSEFAAYLVLTVDRLVLVTSGSFPLNGGDPDDTGVQEVPLNKTMTAIPAASLVGAQCVSRQLLLLTDDGTVQAVGESDGGSMSVAQTPVSIREATPVKHTPSTSQHIRQGIVRDIEEKVDNILSDTPEEKIGDALEAASKKIIDEQPAGSQWLDGGEEIERQFVSKALAEKKRRHDAFCLALQRHHVWSRFEAAGFAITDNGEKLAAMAVLYDLDQKKRFTSLVGEAISNTLETEIAELAIKGVSMKERFFSESSLVQKAVIQLCKAVKEATSEQRISATAEILLAVLRGALDERHSMHANFSCRYSAQSSWIADSATRAALTEFFEAASTGFRTMAETEGDVRDRAAPLATNRPGLVTLLASLARLYFEVFDELMQQQVPVDDEYEAAKALVFTMFSELEMLQEAQQQPILAVLKDERKKLAIDFLYFEGMLLCTFETPQQLARLVKDYHATYGTCGRQFAEFAFSWLEEHAQLHTLLQVAEAAPEDAQQFFEDRPHLGWLFHLGRNDELQQVATASFNAAASDGSVQDQKRWLSVSRLAHRLLGRQDQRQAAALDEHISNRLGLIEVHESVVGEEEDVVNPHKLVRRLLESCDSEHADQVAVLGRALAVVEMADGVAGDIDPAAEDSDGYGDWSLVRDEFRADVQRCWETAIRVDVDAWLEKLAERREGHSEQVIRDFLVEQTVFGKLVSSWHSESLQGRCARCLQVDARQLAGVVEALKVGEGADQLRDLLQMVANACASSEVVE